MLSANNKKDLEKIKRYGRANDMLLLQQFFPEIYPVVDMTVIESEQDFMDNAEYLSRFNKRNRRADTSIESENFFKSNSSLGSGDNLSYIQNIKAENPDGVMVLFNVCYPHTERYGRDGGMSISVNVGKGIFIEYVGKGFDGEMLLKGKATHESYEIGWDEIRSITRGNINEKRVYLVSDEAYKQHVKVWSETLEKGLGYPREEFESHIPETYQGISDTIMADAITIIKKLPKIQDELEMHKLTSFLISGNCEDGRFTPWQMAADTRFKAQLKNLPNVPELQLKKQQSKALKEWERPFR